jgi:hypothetical protein
MIRPIPNLLRRTLVVLGAVAGFATVTDVVAQGTVTLSSGGSCTFSSMTIQPNGNVSVQCSGGQPPPPPPPGQAFFTISGAGSLQPNTAYNTGQFKVSRTDTDGPNDVVAFGYTVTGAGCEFRSQGPYWLTKAAGNNNSHNLDIKTGASGGCTITLTIQEGHTGSTPMNMTVAGPNNETPPPGCNGAAAGSIDRSGNIGVLYRDGGGSSVDQLRMDSGTIAYYKVVDAPKPEQSVLVHFTQGQQANLPAGFTAEFSVSQCKGEINPTLPFPCYQKTVFNNNNSVPIYTAAVPQYGWTSQAAIGERGCYAPTSERPYYVNVKWTYSTCAWGAGNCGTSMQWAPTGSNF